MVPYVLLMFVPLLFSFLMCRKQDGKYIVTVGGSRRVLENNCVLPVFFFCLVLIVSLRGESIGTDTERYKYYFRKIAELEFHNLDRVRLDRLFVLLNWLVARFTDNYQVLLAVIAVFSVWPIACYYCEEREHGFLKLVLFMNMSNFVLLFSGLRQCLALASGLVAYRYVRERKPIRFLIAACIAFGFHHSAFMILLYYPLYYASFKKKHLWFVIPAILAVFVLNRPIFSIAVGILSMISSDKYTLATTSTGAYTMIFVFVAFAVFSYVLPDEKLMDRETLGLRNFLLTAVVLQCFAPIHTLAMRLNYYFIIFIPVLVAKIFKYVRRFNWDVSLLIKGCFVGFFALYYLYSTYVSCRSGISALDIYPYKTFWN